MTQINSICNQLPPIHLDEMNRVRLMNRKEVKYTVYRDLLPFLLKKISPHYEILEIEGEHLMPYKSVYFDTEDYALYTSHQNGKLNRYKVRSRTYELTGAEYLEIKFKTNKKRTIKNRIRIDETKDKEKVRTFTRTSLPSHYENLEEKLTVRYQRLMLVDRAKTERVTIDMNLSCSTPQRDCHYDHMAVIEIKHEGDLKNSPMAQALEEMKIPRISFSKYCLGIADLYGNVKKNAMRLKMRTINKNLESQRLTAQLQ
ncbi:MAG: polyphosphate polymerase domain-containing protein [Spirochaetales bacterium]|nr:polyphosphate polymerase domain-containing protein [Spirochaetales bacterium]